MLNQILLQGRLTAAPEIKYSTNGKAVTAVTLAVERDRVDVNGQRQTDFVTVVMWEGLAERVGRWTTKGQLLTVQGRLQSRIWTNMDGSNRRAWEVVAERVYFIGNARKATSELETCQDQKPLSCVDAFQELADGDDVPF